VRRFNLISQLVQKLQLKTGSKLYEAQFKTLKFTTMKIIKGILFGLLGIIALALIVALLMPKEYAVEREVVINQKTPFF
jgi:hypothetical protein